MKSNILFLILLDSLLCSRIVSGQQEKAFNYNDFFNNSVPNDWKTWDKNQYYDFFNSHKHDIKFCDNCDFDIGPYGYSFLGKDGCIIPYDCFQKIKTSINAITNPATANPTTISQTTTTDISETPVKPTPQDISQTDSNNNDGDKKFFNIDKDGIPFCHSCHVLTIDDNGIKWGYEMEMVCKIEVEYCDKKHKGFVLRGADKIRICTSCNYTRVENDNTMWGDEDGEQCRVISSHCPNANVSDYKFCKGCSIVNTGKDYCLFGYENGDPCIINEIECGYYNEARFFKKIDSKGYSFSKNYVLMTTLILATILFLL